MDDILTMEEIRDRYKDEWVLLGDYELNEFSWIPEARVLFHSKSRVEVHRKAMELMPRRTLPTYVGRIPANTSILL
jgi:hypothetical protein